VLKLYRPDDDPPPRARKAAAPRADRCMGGCGKKRLWPKDGSPLFCSRLCGYLFAVRLLRQRRV
jgi:hypothetical protein